MKKQHILSSILFFSMSFLLMIACGGDDEGSDISNKVDGVNVIKGKKIVELDLYSSEYSDLPMAYLVEYDFKGRLSRILNKELGTKYERDDWNSYYKESHYYTGKLIEIAKIDYDLQTIFTHIASHKYNNITMGFSLNNDGYFSQIGSYTLNYDENGYLISTDAARGLGQLVYDDNNVIKASTSDFFHNYMAFFYVTYGNINNQGDLYIRVTRSEDSRILHKITTQDVICLIAYQAGMFGKVVKTVLNLKESSKELLNYEYFQEEKNNLQEGKITFKWEECVGNHWEIGEDDTSYDDEMETIDGTWTGYIESYYSDRWGISGDTYRTTMFFDKRNTYGGRGYEVDYNTHSRYVDYYYCDFEWTEVNGKIRIHYANSWDDVYIYEYSLNNRYFRGYMDDGIRRDIYFSLESDNSFDWDEYHRRYNYAPTRSTAPDGMTYHASGEFAK